MLLRHENYLRFLHFGYLPLVWEFYSPWQRECTIFCLRHLLQTEIIFYAAVSAGNERVKFFDSVHLALALYLRDLYQIPFCTKEFNLVNYIIDDRGWIGLRITGQLLTSSCVRSGRFWRRCVFRLIALVRAVIYNGCSFLYLPLWINCGDSS